MDLIWQGIISIVIVGGAFVYAGVVGWLRRRDIAACDRILKRMDDQRQQREGI